MARSAVFRFLYRSRPNAGGRPLRDPLRRWAAWLSVFLRGLPGPIRGTRNKHYEPLQRPPGPTVPDTQG